MLSKQKHSTTKTKTTIIVSRQYKWNKLSIWPSMLSTLPSALTENCLCMPTPPRLAHCNTKCMTLLFTVNVYQWQIDYVSASIVSKIQWNSKHRVMIFIAHTSYNRGATSYNRGLHGQCFDCLFGLLRPKWKIVASSSSSELCLLLLLF